MHSASLSWKQDKSVHQVAAFLRGWPRASAALGFGAAGTTLCLLLWGPIIFQAQGMRPFVLFIGTPGVSAAVAGCALGNWLLDSTRVYSPRSAALRGAVIGSMALLFFSPLFAAVYVLTQPATEHWDIASLTLLVLVGTIFVIWLRVALIGAAVGWVLYRLALRDTGRMSAEGH